MPRFSFSRMFALIAMSTGLAACGGNAPLLSTPVSAANAYLLTSNHRIIGVDLDDLEYVRSVTTVAQATTSTAVAGALDMDEVILDMDYRNAEGQLYALTRKGTEGRIIRVDPRSGSIARVSTLTADAADNVGEAAPYGGLSATASYTMDFNPVVDRLRVIGSDGSNLRVDALTGETITDTRITPAGSQVSGIAYRDDFNLSAGAGRATTLFSIDLNAGSSGKVFPTDANGGVLTSPGKDLGLSSTNQIGGYDINPQNNVGIAVVTVAGSTRVYTINPAVVTGNAATLFGVLPKLPGSETYQSLALVTTANPTVTALTNTNGLVTFRALEPAMISSITAAPGVSGDTLVGIDFRQSDRVLYGLGLSGKVYNLTPASPSSTATTGALSSSANYTLDFNPASSANKLRLIDSLSNNYVIDVDAVTRADKPAITSSAPVTPVVAGLAYSNNFRGSTATQLLAIDRANSTLNLIAITAPTSPATTPAEGTLTSRAALGITLDPASPVGFDISGRNNDNQLLMARTASTGNFTLYRVNSAATINPLTPVGEIDSSASFIDIAIRF